MTRFLNGPAAGVVLALARSPKFLRAVRNRHGDWDALDQLNDEPGEGEEVFAYYRVADDGWLHVDFTRKKSAWYKRATYALYDPQPGADQLRTRALWRRWCLDRAAAG